MDARWVAVGVATGWAGIAVGWTVVRRAMRAERRREQMWLAASQTTDPITSMAMLEALLRAVPQRSDREAVMRWVVAGGKPLDPNAPEMMRRAYLAVYEAANPPQEM